jgi:hypothetical protein
MVGSNGNDDQTAPHVPTTVAPPAPVHAPPTHLKEEHDPTPPPLPATRPPPVPPMSAIPLPPRPSAPPPSVSHKYEEAELEAPTYAPPPPPVPPKDPWAGNNPFDA